MASIMSFATFCRINRLRRAPNAILMNPLSLPFEQHALWNHSTIKAPIYLASVLHGPFWAIFAFVLLHISLSWQFIFISLLWNIPVNGSYSKSNIWIYVFQFDICSSMLICNSVWTQAIFCTISHQPPLLLSMTESRRWNFPHPSADIAVLVSCLERTSPATSLCFTGFALHFQTYFWIII